LWARALGNEQVELSDRAEWHERITARDGEGLADLAKRGVKIRTRALATTLFARLLLADVFVHGIGGAKYDQITDVLLSEFIGVTPTAFMVATATLRLPIPHARTTLADLREMDEKLRRLAYQPERFVNEFSAECRAAEAEKWLTEKRHWIDTAETPENARHRWQAIRDLNEQLQPCMASLRERLLRERAAMEKSLRAAAILDSREYAFCLHPESSLRKLMTGSSAAIAAAL
jgi:hypothetical protein